MADADLAADARLLVALAQTCERWTPIVTVDGGDGLLLDITGCAHLWGGETELGRRVQAWLAQLGTSARVAIAGAPVTAHAVARHGGSTRLVPAGGDEAVARTLPLAALEADPDVHHGLARAGLDRIGLVADQPAAALAARFGTATVARLDALLGRGDTRIVPLRRPPPCLVVRRFAEPLAHAEGVAAVLVDLLNDAAAELVRRGQGGRHFELSLFRTDSQIRRLAVETAAPVRDPTVLRRLFGERMDSLADPLDPGFGFDAVSLGVGRLQPLVPVQLAAFNGDSPAADAVSVGELIDRLVARLGRERVLRAYPVDRRLPEAAARLRPAMDAEPASWPLPEPGQPPTRPLYLFVPPHAIEAMAEVPDGPPLRFSWRRTLHTVVLAEGPERIGPEWWRADAVTSRDYYRVEDSHGRRFWLFREGAYGDAIAPRWFLHGLFA